MTFPWNVALAGVLIMNPLVIPVNANDTLPIQYTDFALFETVEPLLIFVIEFGDFSCPACLESLLNLCRLLPSHLVRERACGIVVSPHRDSRSIKIMEQKIRGFRSANNIAFPLLLDRDHIFRSLATHGTTLILFSPRHGSILKLSFPLSESETERVLQIWLPKQ